MEKLLKLHHVISYCTLPSCLALGHFGWSATDHVLPSISNVPPISFYFYFLSVVVITSFVQSFVTFFLLLFMHKHMLSQGSDEQKR